MNILSHQHSNSTQIKKSIRLIAHTLRGLSLDSIAIAKSGHPGLPLGMADVAAVLWTKYLKQNPSNPDWYDRDRFVLSAGHGSIMLYSLFYLFGFDLPLTALKKFRQWGSLTPGHPENFITKGVETTTGPLGQGIANAVGMALATVSLAARFNTPKYRITNHFTYTIVSDGDLQEGISHEACSFAGHNKLGNLIVFYDNNGITIDGHTNLSCNDVITKRFESYHWHVVHINGHDLDSIEDAIEEARSTLNKPSLIVCDTLIGYGSPNRAGTAKAHGEPFPEEEIKATKKNLGLPADKSFFVPDEVKSFLSTIIDSGKKSENQWNKLFASYSLENPKLAKAFNNCISKKFKSGWGNISKFSSETEMATRTASGKILNYISPKISSLIGGSADLTPSNNTLADGEKSFSTEYPSGRYIHYGIREHSMAAIMNGMALHGGVLPYSGTFFALSDYMRPAIRMAALMKIQVLYVFTHDSIGLGEDGPTHQPVSHLASLRAMPNMLVLRPMDANETIVCWKIALKHKTGPSALILTRQKVPIYNRNALGYTTSEHTLKGGYTLIEDTDFESIIIASGSEVQIALKAKSILNQKGIPVRIVSMPCTALFDKQSPRYRSAVLPDGVSNRVAIEAGATMSWWKYIGLKGTVIGLDRFGASAPYNVLFEKFGITAIAVANAVINYTSKKAKK